MGKEYDGGWRMSMKKYIVIYVVLLLVVSIFGTSMVTRVSVEDDFSRSGRSVIEEDAIEIEDWHDLDAVREDLSVDYVLMNDLDETTGGYGEYASENANELVKKRSWTNGEKYERNDLVEEDGEKYYCIQDHMADSNNKPGSGENWESYWVETDKEAEESLGWQPIGFDEFDGFSGTFDGNGYEIKDVQIDREDEEFAGVFASNVNGTIKNVTISDSDIIGLGRVGSLVGANKGVVDNCKSENVTIKGYGQPIVNYRNMVGGLVGVNGWEYSVVNGEMKVINSEVKNATVEGDLEVGGFVGRNDRTIEDCEAKGVDVYGGFRVGGFAGVIYFDSHTEKCHSSGFVEGGADEFDYLHNTGDVGGFVGYYASSILPVPTMSEVFSEADVKGNEKVGGFVGHSDNFPAYLKNAFSTGDVEGQDMVGGFAGVLGVDAYNCYSIGEVVGEKNTGGFSGEDLEYGAIVENCYWNIETSNQNTSFHGEGKTTEDMTYPHTEEKDTFHDFDEEIWDLGDHRLVEDREGNTGYPALQWQNEEIGEFILMIQIEGEGSTEPDEGTYTYEEGTEVTVKAIPDEGWYFYKWTGDAPEGEEGEEIITITMDESKEVTAHFQTDETYELTVNTVGEGSVDIEPEKEKYEHGEKVYLTAVPDEGHEFVDWEGTDETEEEITITMDQDKEITAVFEEEDNDIPGFTSTLLLLTVVIAVALYKKKER